MNVGDLEKIGVTEDINFFSSKFFDFLKDREEEFLKIISKYEHRFNNKRDSKFFGEEGNLEVRLLMGEVLSEYLVKDSDISSVFDFSDKLTKLVLPKKVIDVSFQGLVNSYIDKKHHFKVWQVRDLFGKHNMNYMMSRYVLTHSISDLSKPAKRVIRDYGYTKGNSFYSKLNAKQLNKYLSELKGELVGDDNVVLKSNGSNKNFEKSESVNVPAMIMPVDFKPNTYEIEIGNPVDIGEKVRSFYEKFNLTFDNGSSEVLKNADVALKYLESRHKDLDPVFIKFLRSDIGGDLLSFKDINPNTRLINRLYNLRDLVFEHFNYS